MKLKHQFYTILFAFLAFHSNAQIEGVSIVNNKYDSNSFIDEISIYEQVAKKGYKDETMFRKLGNSYYFNDELQIASKWYSELYAMNQSQEAEFYYRYAQSLKSTSENNKSEKMMEIFNKKSGNFQRSKSINIEVNPQEEIKANSGRYNIIDAGINSEFSDYGSAYYINNNIVFATSRDKEESLGKKNKSSNQLITSLYQSEVKLDGSLASPIKFDKEINSKFNIATPIFTKDGLTMYFTGNNYINGKVNKKDDKEILLKLYKASFLEGKWGNIVELPFNGNNYSTAHPALSQDNKTLYFASNMSGTLGQSDLYKVEINDLGGYSIPVNLGNSINTEGRESFPFISEKNELYFASDSIPGLGGLDVFVTKIFKDGTFDKVKNVGSPVNGADDDFSFIINTKTKNGFFSSNRLGGNGSDDIYKLIETRSITCEKQVSGSIIDLDTKGVITDVKMKLFDENFKLIQEKNTEANGQYSFDVMCGKVYYIRAENENYETKEAKVVINSSIDNVKFSLMLNKRIHPLDVGSDLAKILNIPVIYFATNKSDIREEAVFELEKIAAILNQYPNMKIDVLSYTDSRQSAKSNLFLSEKRAKATINWFEKNGIDKKRLKGKGFGETKLVNNCSDGVYCSEEEHMKNRRSEFIIKNF